MPYLNLDPDYFSHPKTVRLCGLLGPEAGVYPLKLWAYCAKFHAVDADLSTYSKGEIESAIGWHGEAGKLVDSLVRVGMLVVCNGHFCVHDWKEHQGHLEAYKVRGKLAADARWAKLRKKSVKNTTSNTTSIPQAMPQPTNQPTNQQDKERTSSEPPKGGRVRSVVLFDKESDAYSFAYGFAHDFLLDWAPNAKKPNEQTLQAWAKDADSMFRLDGRTFDEAGALLNWIHSAPEDKRTGFSWRKNIRSVPTLRQRWNEGKFSDFKWRPD